MILLVVWSANDNSSTSKASSKDNLINFKKMDPITGRASSFLVLLYVSLEVGVSKEEVEEEGETEQQQQTYQFTQGYNILHRLQVYHLTLTFIIPNKYISTLYYIHYVHTFIL